MNSDSESKESLLSKLQFDAHSIIRNFPARVLHFADFRAHFVQDRVGVVYVNQNPPASFWKITLRQETIRPGERNMSNLARCLRPNPGTNQFVLVPEGSVEETKIARLHPLLPFL